MTLTQLMKAKADELDRDAGRVDRRGHYRRACEMIRMAQVLRELSAQLDAWERTQAGHDE